jgi:hypothetical protein
MMVQKVVVGGVLVATILTGFQQEKTQLKHSLK